MSTYGHIDFTLKPPYYGRLKNYEWVDDFLAVEEIRKEMKFINSKKLEIMRTLSARESIKDRFKESFERYEQRRIERLSKILIKNQRSNDPFSTLEKRLAMQPALQRIGISLSWDDVERAIDLMPLGDDVLTDAERIARQADLDKAIEDLKAKIQENSPPGYFILREGIVLCDSRDELVKHWFNIQSKCNAACTPQGFNLRLAPEAEKTAYKKLGIAKVINKGISAPGPHPDGEKWMEARTVA